MAPLPATAPTIMASVALLPSSPVESQSPFAIAAQRQRMLQKPRLSLNTACPGSIGRGSTAIRAVSAVSSPTVRNTFKNTFEPPPPSTPLCHVQPAKVVEDEQTSRQPGLPALVSHPPSLETSLPGLTTQNETPTTPRLLLPNNRLRSILRSSAFPRPSSPHIVQSNAPNTISKTIRSVVFAEPLTEEIQNHRYLLRHSDIPSCEPSPVAGLEQLSPKTGEKRASPSPDRESADNDSESESESDGGCPKTPVAGRNKKRRDWVWTLGPISPSTSGPVRDMTYAAEGKAKQSIPPIS